MPANLSSGPCPLCQADVTESFRFGLKKCSECGLVLSPSIWKTGVNEQMESDWFGADWRPGRSFWTALFEDWNNRKTLSRLSQHKTTGKRLLEVGVGSGSFLDVARTAGYEVTGCDLSPSVCKWVSENLCLPMHCGPIAELRGDGVFDVIILNHVLEHVEQPGTFLKEVVRLLAPNGIVHVAVPNVKSWEALLSGWTSYEPYHLSYFDEATLLRAMDVAGLRSRKISTTESFSGWFLAALRTFLGINRKGGAIARPIQLNDNLTYTQRSSWKENIYRISMVIFGTVSWPIRKFQAACGAGDEIVCIASLKV